MFSVYGIIADGFLCIVGLHSQGMPIRAYKYLTSAYIALVLRDLFKSLL